MVLHILPSFMKIFESVSELLSGHEIKIDIQTYKRTNGQGDYYRAPADFVWWGPNGLLTIVKKRNLKWVSHVSSSGLAKTVLQAIMNTNRGRVRPKKRKEDTIKELTGMDFASSTTVAKNRTRWKLAVAKLSVLGRPSKFIV